MSFPPRYQRIPDGVDLDLEAQRSKSPFIASQDADPESSTAINYPPTPIPTLPGQTVIYEFRSRWPMPQHTLYATSKFGVTRHATALIIKRAFPELSPFSPERIEILMPVSGEFGSWGRITDEAWDEEVEKKPKTLRVQVMDMPGDRERRKSHENKQTLKVLGVIFGTPILLFLVIFLSIMIFKPPQ